MMVNEIFLEMNTQDIQNKDYMQLRRDAIQIRNNIMYNVNYEILKNLYETFNMDVDDLIMSSRNDETQLKNTLVQIYNFLAERL